MDENGMFRQAEMTSCGLTVGRSEASAHIRLGSPVISGRRMEQAVTTVKTRKKAFAEHPYFTQDKKDGDENARQYIANMRDGAVAGFKYFEMGEAKEISVELTGQARGKMLVSEERDFSVINAEISIENLNKGKYRIFFCDKYGKRGKGPVFQISRRRICRFYLICTEIVFKDFKRPTNRRRKIV